RLDGHDVGMVELADLGDLVAEAGHVVGVGSERRGEHLDGHLAVGVNLSPAVDLGHAAPLEQPLQQIVAKPATSQPLVVSGHARYSISRRPSRYARSYMRCALADAVAVRRRNCRSPLVCLSTGKGRLGRTYLCSSRLRPACGAPTSAGYT